MLWIDSMQKNKQSKKSKTEFNSSEYEFSCQRCGSCCKAWLDVYIEQKDIEKWKLKERRDLLQYIQIDPKTISEEGLAGFHIEEKNAVLILKKKYSGKELEKKLEELINFIEENHYYAGINEFPLPIYTIIPGKEKRPIFVPKSFEVMKKGLKRGISYMIFKPISGECPLLKDNLCSIQNIKPEECKLFPYDENGELDLEEYRISICKGLKKKQNRE